MASDGNDDKQMSKELDQRLISDINKTVADFFGLSKAMQAGILYHAGYGAEDIGNIVKTSVGYVHNIMRDMRTKPKFKHRVLEIVSQFPDWFRSSRQATLPVLAAAQNKAAHLYLEKPELLIDKPQLAKQMLMAAGVKTEEERKSQFININLNLLQQVQETRLKEEIDIRNPHRTITVDTEEME